VQAGHDHSAWAPEEDGFVLLAAGFEYGAGRSRAREWMKTGQPEID